MESIFALIMLKNTVMCGIPVLILLLVWVIKLLRRIALAQEIAAKLAIYKFKDERGGQFCSEGYTKTADAMNISLKKYKK